MLRIKSSNTLNDLDASVEELTARVNTALESGDLSEAYVLQQRLIEAGPESVQTHTTAGLMAVQLDRLGEATIHFTHALKLAPDDFNTNYNVALAEMRHERYNLALQRFRHLRRLQPHNADLWNDLGVVWLQKNRRARALASFSRALKLDPDNSNARNNAMELCLSVGLINQARRILEYQEQKSKLSVRAEAEVHRWRQILDNPNCILEDEPALTGQEEEN